MLYIYIYKRRRKRVDHTLRSLVNYGEQSRINKTPHYQVNDFTNSLTLIFKH